jgi:hypothetical protein
MNSLDLSKLHLFKNQATCAPGFVTLTQEGGGPGLGFCAFTGFGLPASTVQLCLTDPTIDPTLLEGLTVNMTGGGSFITSNCSQGDPLNECSVAGYSCDVNGATISECVTSLECPDGTVITTCGDVGGCSSS